ncbi:polysaccharide deacetylase family protein [Paenibacillus psychroresistens]|uniref:Polysaccharide deacetylase family protein n=2 Tax=Paenibacillus psychroresistens TaxID=1778678 RepID=A0A6B8RU85_9BACL|nr:polysaccharide deacetylase family protein [Paenibacillus psychroresistens]
MSGCSQTYHSAIHSPNQVQTLEQPGIQTPYKISNGLTGFLQDEWTFSVSPTTVPKPAKKPVLKPKPSPAPRITQKKKKEPSIPAQQSQQKKLTLPQLRLKYPQFFRLNGSNHESKIALTFDDGPDNKYTPQILDVLQKYHVKATFFVLGIRAQANPSIIRRIVNEGHAIGNHSYDHANPAKMTEAQFEKQFTQTQLILDKLIGYEPKLIRTPYGAIQENQLKWAAKNGLIAVNWDIDSLDWKELSDSQVVANIMEHTHKGAIILQHSAGGDSQDLSGTLKALPIVIEQLKKQGFKLVTVPELLHLPVAK